MNLNDSFNRTVWYVLNKIKTICIKSNNNSTIIYDIDLLNSQHELSVLKTLDDWNIIHILCQHLTRNLKVSLCLSVQPQFEALYRKMEQLHEYYSHDAGVEFAPEKPQPLEVKPDSTILKQEKIHFSKYCLEQDVEHFESTLKRFFELGSISQEDFQFLSHYSKTVRKFLHKAQPAKKSRQVKRKKLIVSDTQQPLPIVANVTVEGLKEGLEKIARKSPQSYGHKFPFKIPAGTEWEHFIITFLDEERIEIEVKNIKHVADYKELDMIGKGAKPSEQWIFLKVLAKYFGELSIKDPEAKEKYKKQKRTLTSKLQHYFSLEFDPFYPYQRRNSYHIKITLIPPAEPKDNFKKPKDVEIDTDSLGIHEYLSEVAPQIADY